MDLGLAERRAEAKIVLGDEEGASDDQLKLRRRLRELGRGEEADELKRRIDRLFAKFIPAQRAPAHDNVEQPVTPPPPRRLPHHRKHLTDRELSLIHI